MQFRTYINIKPATEQIDHQKSIFSIGSCFAENIASKLQRAKFRVTSSPTGILFNPESIANTISRLATLIDKTAIEADIKEGIYSNGERCFNYDFHSSLCDSDIATATAKMVAAHNQGREALLAADIVIITFGSAWVYRLRETGQVVANCHKQPHNLFSRELLSVEQITKQYEVLLTDGILANKRVIFTVSPIRHLADGLEENSLSKATLRVAISELARKYSNVEYFPSFEILNDELRDYRFYADDMIHPSAVAIDYIWQRFSEWAISDSSRQLIEQVERIAQATQHRPLNPTSEAHKKFCKQMIEQIEHISKHYPCLDFSNERESFCRYL